MGLRGPAPKPTLLRRAEGNRSRRPLPTGEPTYQAGVPDQPPGMNADARRIWDRLVAEMAPTGVLRTVDGFALAQLCEDQALLNGLRVGLRKAVKALEATAKREGKVLPGGALVGFSQSIEGRRTLATIRELSARVIVQRREFGLTPSSNSRVQTPAGAAAGQIVDALEAKLCG